jgi:MSHA biogenesis protein MshJ
MNARAVFVNATSRFNAMSLRERGMIAVAVLAVVVLLWDRFLMSPLQAKKEHLTQEIGEVHKNLALLTESIEGRSHDNPLTLAMEQRKSLTQSLAAVDKELQSASAGLIAPQRMLSALRDVLNNQQGLRLVSMRNLPVASLLPPAQQLDEAKASQEKRNAAPVAATGPYVHSLEIVVEGGYLDVLHYLQSVEALPWRFYWQVLELKTTEYPINHVRIRLNTLSMDKEWLGV